MHPELFRIGGRAVETDGALYFLATVVAALYVGRVFRRHGWNPDHILPGLVLVVLASYLGAKLHGALSPWDDFVRDPLGAILTPGDLSFYGGMALGAAATVGYIRARGYPLGVAADALAPLGPVLYALFRLGCLMNGDDYGRPTGLPWGMSFPEGSPPTTARVHPTQIYEIVAMGPILAWLLARRDRGLPAGALAWELAIGMGLERFVVEFWRRGEAWLLGLTPAQWISLVLIAVAVFARLRLDSPGRGGSRRSDRPRRSRGGSSRRAR